MNLVTVREDVIFDALAAASFRRLEAEVGTIRCNSTFRDPELQMRMHLASLAYVNGTGPYPGHAWAAHPRDSQHCAGRAFDANRSFTIRASARPHGWYPVTRAGEEHHLEYREWLDENRTAPASTDAQPLTPKEWYDDMTPEQLQQIMTAAFLDALRQNSREEADKTVTYSVPDGAGGQVYWAVDFDANTKARLWNGEQLDIRRALGFRELLNQPPQSLDGFTDITVQP